MSAATDIMPRQKRNDVVVKLDAEVYRMAKILAAYEDAPVIAEFLSEILRPILEEKMRRHSLPLHPKPKRKAD